MHNAEHAQMVEMLEQMEFAREARDIELALQRSLEEGPGRPGGAAPAEARQEVPGLPGMRSHGVSLVQRVGAANDDIQRTLLERLIAQAMDGEADHVSRRLLPCVYSQRGMVHGSVGSGPQELQEILEQSRRQHLVRELPREKYCKQRHEDLLECELCLEEYEDGAELMRLPCLHAFHSSCVGPWLYKAKSCPVCQTDCVAAAGL